ncbi:MULTISPECIES: hypothetical protein [unclassified Microbacterium]|uniref:hypothetical protein n=1 Tax=unclassified Microbacterium TaxID=2609290 RepID=UPI003019EF1E
MTPTPDIRIVRRRDLMDAPDYRRLRAHVRAGAWCRVAPGAYARGAEWASLTPRQQHRVRVEEVVARLDAAVVVSHFSAAAVWGIDVLGAWPTLVDLTTPRASGGRSGGAIRRRALGLDGVATVGFGAHEVTTPAQTALDLARCLPFVPAVTAIDRAISTRRLSGALTDRSEILALMDANGPRRGDARARRALAASDALSDNVRETQLRLLVIALGFPLPRLQERRVLRSGRLVFGDLYFPEEDHWLELDGRGKYRSPEFGPDRDAAEIAIDEKNRENEIRREVRGFSRLEPADLDHPRRVYDILTADGLRATRPRPPHS